MSKIDVRRMSKINVNSMSKSKINVRCKSVSKTNVRRFWLQETKSFKEGAPQRESYLDDRSFDRACVAYADEWRRQYRCAGCNEVECPQCCGAQGVSS